MKALYVAELSGLTRHTNVLQVSSNSDLQLALGPFAFPECEAAGVRIGASKSEAMVLGWERGDCPLWVVEELLYVRVFFMSQWGMEQEIDRWIGLRLELDLSIVVNSDLNEKVKFSI